MGTLHFKNPAFEAFHGPKKLVGIFFLMLTRCLKSSHERGVKEQAYWIPDPARGCSPRGLSHRAMFLIMREYAVFQERADEEMLSRTLDGVTESSERRSSLGYEC